MNTIWNGHPVTHYFYNDILLKRTYLKLEWCIAALQRPLRKEHQVDDGRIRHWCYIPEHTKYLRVVTLEDGITIHNAFFDRGFKP